MRAVGALLLLLQLRPVAGLLLCQVMGASSAEQMESGCPMADDQTAPLSLSRPSNPGRAAGSGSLTVLGTPDGDSHQCALAELCSSPPPLVGPAQLSLSIVATPFRPVPKPTAALFRSTIQAPPVPPPKS